MAAGWQQQQRWRRGISGRETNRNRRKWKRRGGSGGRDETEVTATGTAKTGLVDCGGGEKEATAVVQWQRRFLILLRSCVMVCGCVGVDLVNVFTVVLGAM